MSKSKISEKKVWEKLKTVDDPELGIDIVSLGFIYDVAASENEIKVKYSLTTPGCPLANFIAQRIRQALAELVRDPQEQIQLELVFEPPWNPEMMSPEAKEALNYQ